jgi:enamine deaminase RidA (YjgF/YER057c/UK114 family)
LVLATVTEPTPTDDHLIVPELARFEADWRFSHVVRTRGLLLLSGVTGTDEHGHVSGDPTTQFEQAFEHLRLHLATAGAAFREVAEMTTYHVDLRRHLDAFTAVKDRHILQPYPAWSAIGVSELITPGALLEIRAVALDPQRPPPGAPPIDDHGSIAPPATADGPSTVRRWVG